MMKLTWSKVLLVLLVTAPGIGSTQSLNDIEGLWELVEWHHGEAVLRPPDVGGRFSLEGGTILFMVHRELEGESEYLYGYGPYIIDGNEYRYGYDYFIQVTVKGSEREIWSGPDPINTYIAESNGSDLRIMDAESGTNGLLLEGDRLTWMQESKPLRVYERIRN